MKNWPKYTKWRKEERKRKNSERFLSFIEHLPNWNIGNLQEFKITAKNRHEQSEHMNVRCPQGIAVSPAFLTFYDLYFTEDFIALESGLINLLESSINCQPCLHSPQDEIPELFQTWKKSPGGGSWHRIGHMTFERSPLHPDTFKALSIDLFQISPTCISLAVSAFPSDSFQKRFSALISSEVQNTNIVNPSYIFSRQWQSRILLSSKVRQNEIEELFLDVNREVVLFLRKYIGRGWAATGPLPSVHCFSYTHESGVDPKDKSYSEFWRSLGLMRIPSLNYSNGSGVDVIHPYSGDKGTFTKPYRILVDSVAYLTEARTQHYASPEMAMFYNLEHKFIHPLVPLFALREQCLRLVNITSEHQNRLAPTITIKKNFLVRLWAIIQLMYIPPRLNSLRFTLARVTDSTVQRFLDHSATTDFRRETRKDTDEGFLKADLRHEMEYLGNYVSEQLDILRNAYHDLWNFCIQWILIILALIGLFIAVAQVFPKQQDAKPPSKSTFVEQLNSLDEDAPQSLSLPLLALCPAL